MTKLIVTFHKCEGKAPHVEEALNQRFCIVTGRDVHVSGPVLRSLLYNADEIGLIYHATLDSLPELQTCNTVWFRESNGLYKCVILFKRVRN